MEEKKIINTEYDYSNIVPSVEYIKPLAEYCSQIYAQFINMTEEDEEKNKQFKEEYKEYNYKKNYGTYFEIAIKDKEYTNNIICKDINSFKSAISSGNLKRVRELVINLEMDFKRGNGLNLDEHDNKFIIEFIPYKITLRRKSNYNDSEMNQIENNLKEVLNNFPVTNTIFCDKGD